MENFNSYPGGSAWHRWDLHVHTPASVIQDFGGDSDEVWEKYICDLEALPSEFKAIGINDYFLIDGYERILKEKRDNGKLKNIDLLLPVLEFRLTTLAGSTETNKINFHVIFSDKISPETIREHFLKRIPIKYGSKWDSAISSRADLKRFGEMVLSDVPSDKQTQTALEMGFNSLTYELESIKATLENRQYFYENGAKLFLTALGRVEWDGMRWDSSPAYKREIIQGVDFVFGGSRDQAEYLNTRKKLRAQAVNDRLFHFSDAHNYSNATKGSQMKIGDSLTWIKANPTFEGLRQTLFEFDERVAISKVNPSQRNPGTYLSSIKFFSPQSKFPKEAIVFGPYLNVVIGGFSMGKSMLLHLIGLSIDPKEMEKIGGRLDKDDKGGQTFLRKYSFISEVLDPQFDTVVAWADGKEDLLKKGANPSNRKILCFPQGYIGTLSDPERTKTKAALDTYILDIAKQIPEIAISEAEFLEQVRASDVHIESMIDQLHRSNKERLDAERKLKTLGELDNIKAYITTLEDNLQLLRQQSGLTEAQMEEYTELTLNSNSLGEQKTILESDRVRFISFAKEIKADHQRLKDKNLQFKNETQDHSVKQQIEKLESQYEVFFASIESTLSSIYQNTSESITDRIKSLESLLIENTSLKKPFLEKLQEQQLVISNEKAITQEKQKITEIVKQQNIVTSKVATELRLKTELWAKFSKIQEAYSTFCNQVNSSLNEISHEISLVISTQFYFSKLREQLEPKINKKQFGKTRGGFQLSNFDRSKEFTGVSEFLPLIKSFFDDIVEGRIVFNQGYQMDDLLRDLLKDRYFTNWKVKYKGDLLENMSPGKANLVILKLLIEMSDDEWPVLIDQPEDHLDNKSIITDLVPFLKKKKKTRQIIVATHNPNLLLMADAENIIVASREGEGTAEHRFDYITGGIENSFKEIADQHGIRKMGIRQHICDILEGGIEAFRKREGRYGFEK